MALLFMDGFDKGDFAKKWVPDTVSSSTTTRFNTGRSLHVSYGTARKYIPATTRVIVGGACMVSGPSRTGFVIYNATAAQFYVILNASGLELRFGTTSGTLLASSAAANHNNWNYLEVEASIANSGGVCKVRVNGVELINYTGDTLYSGTDTTVQSIQLDGGLWDDVYICDNTGTTNNAFLGEVRVQTLVPVGAGSSTQLTPTGAANYANVAETPDSTATYNSSSTVGHRDTYEMGDLLGGTTAVFGIQDNIAASKADAGAGNVKAALKVGSTVYYDSTVALNTSAGTWYGAVREVNPATSTAWTTGDVNGIEFGAEVA